LAGTVTGSGSRGYSRTIPVKETTASAIQQLLDWGAVCIGKTKASAFAFGAWPDQSFNYHYSWNPRGDGALGLSASSYGSAAAIAATDLLDFTIGSDTGGSVRNPADRVGVYGIRPTHNVIPVDGVISKRGSC
jgi:Asp-tRNA(Asn)/Glu-tRNA(Gln) amidotransferase A subunit family amidase